MWIEAETRVFWWERTQLTTADFEHGGGLSTVCGQDLEDGKGNEIDFPLELQKGAQACQYFDFSPVSPALDFWPPEL